MDISSISSPPVSSAAPAPRIGIAYGDAPEQTGDLLLPAGEITAATPKLLLIHGGGWRSPQYLRGTLSDEAVLFRDAGYAVYNIDYRLAPAAAWPVLGEDCLAAARKLISCDGFPELAPTAGQPIAILGVSSGGHLALMTGFRLPRAGVLGVISVSGIADPASDASANPARYEALFAGGPIDKTAFPAAHLSPDAPPVLLTHCWNDTVVSIASQITFAREMTDCGLRVETYFYDMERTNQGHAIWDVADKSRHVFYSDLHERCLAFLRDVRGLPQPLPGGATPAYLGKLRRIPASEIRESPVSIGFECLDRDLFDPDPCYDRLAAIGVKHARVQTGWWKCEKVKGVYDWTWLDGIVTNLERRGIDVWFNVGFGNKLYMADTYGEASVGFVPIHYGPECETAWKNFCRALAVHFKGRVSRFEIWNEANGRGFWRPRDPNAAEYARLLSITADAIREGQPDARCGGCLSGYPMSFVKELKRQGAFAKLDFFAFHPYDPQPEQAWPAHVAWFKALLAGAGRNGRDISVWQGESGFASWTPEKYWQPRFVRESERAQAVWLLRRYVLDISLGLELSSYFQTADMMKKGYQMGEHEQKALNVARQGVLNGLTYTPKPAFSALASIAAIFRDGVRPVAGPRFMTWQDDARPKRARHARLENVAVRCLTFARGRTPYHVYYMPADPQFGWADKEAHTTLEIAHSDDLDDLRSPVLVNLLTGDVFALTLRDDSAKDGAHFIDNLPLCDAPLLVCDRAAVEIVV